GSPCPCAALILLALSTRLAWRRPNLKPAQRSQQLHQEVCCAHSADSKKNSENHLFKHGSSPPILLGFAFHCRCVRVLHFEPIGRTAGTVGRILALRDNAFEAKLAGMGEDGRAVAFDMLVEPDAGAGLGHDRREPGLADFKRIVPQIVAVQLDEVEGVEEYAP